MLLVATFVVSTCGSPSQPVEVTPDPRCPILDPCPLGGRYVPRDLHKVKQAYTNLHKPKNPGRAKPNKATSHRVRTNAKSQTGAKLKGQRRQLWASGENINHCSRRAQRSREANASSHRRAMFARVSFHSAAPRLDCTNGSIAISPASRAIDIPLPVAGGIIVSASPIAQSSRSLARRGSRVRPATVATDFGSNVALRSRSSSFEPGAP